MSTLKHLSLRGLRLFRWMWTTINTFLLFLTWPGKNWRNHVFRSQLIVCAGLPERETLLQEKKEIQVIINTKFLTLLYWSESFTEHGKQTFMPDFFCKQPTRPNSLGLITVLSQIQHIQVQSLFFVGHLKNKPISSVSCMTVCAGIR